MAGLVHTGGCQCGAVRFRVTGALDDASICHCRMCQKAFGAYYEPLVSTRGAVLEWTRGAPRHFQSSNLVRRGFCADCGTPLTYEYGDGDVGLSIGALDRPAETAPRVQLASSAELPYFAGLAALPVHADDEPRAAAHLASIVSYQHPDHDTAEWPPKP